MNDLGHYNGVSIYYDDGDSDKFVNATQMCKATGKRWAKYWENQSTQEFLVALADSLRCPISDLYFVRQGRGDTVEQGTWVHRQVAIHLAQWCSADFSVWVTGGDETPRQRTDLGNNVPKLRGRTGKTVRDAIQKARNKPLAEHGEIGNGRKDKSRVDNVNSTKGGNGTEYTLRRLARDAPDMLDRIEAGELSVNQAANELMMLASLFLMRRRMGRLIRRSLKISLVDVTSLISTASR